MRYSSTNPDFMSRAILPQAFFAGSALSVAASLLGKKLVIGGDRPASAIITEVEAYTGSQDRACHAHRGKTTRNAPMFGPPGHWYVYFCYGMHWMLNVVTCATGYPAAVLIRGIAGADGPGKLTKMLGIDARFNARPANRHTGLWIEDTGITIPTRSVVRSPRIGVEYAGAWAQKPYRFTLASPDPVGR